MQSFLEFMNDVTHWNAYRRNQIFFNGNPIDKWEAYATYGSYEKMKEDKRITIEIQKVEYGTEIS